MRVSYSKPSPIVGICIAVFLIAGITNRLQAEKIAITIENLAQESGTFLTPTWVGFHNGGFDIYDLGSAASAGLQSLAEDGNATPLNDAFIASSAGVSGGVSGSIFAPGGFPGVPVFDPGESATEVFDIGDATINRFFSYATMVIPSNDAFIANGNPLAHELFDATGKFLGPISFTVFGSEVLDAGTEANTENDAAFFNQAAAGDGTVTTDVVGLHPGFIDSIGNPGGTSIILGGTSGAGIFFDGNDTDFTIAGSPVARISVEVVPEPSTYALFAIMFAAIAYLGKTSKKECVRQV